MVPNWRALLDQNDIKWVRFVWADLGNRIRGEAIHIDAIESVATSGPAFTEGLMGLMLLWDHVAPDSGLSPVGQVWARPDWSTLRLPPYLTLGAIIAAGLHGLDEVLPLPESVDVDPNVLSDEDLAERGLSVLPRAT